MIRFPIFSEHDHSVLIGHVELTEEAVAMFESDPNIVLGGQYKNPWAEKKFTLLGFGSYLQP